MKARRILFYFNEQQNAHAANTGRGRCIVFDDDIPKLESP